MRKLSAEQSAEPYFIVVVHTSGSETSQYREEKKLIRISLVAASEREQAQTLEPRFCTPHLCVV